MVSVSRSRSRSFKRRTHQRRPSPDIDRRADTEPPLENSERSHRNCRAGDTDVEVEQPQKQKFEYKKKTRRGYHTWRKWEHQSPWQHNRSHSSGYNGQPWASASMTGPNNSALTTWRPLQWQAPPPPACAPIMAYGIEASPAPSPIGGWPQPCDQQSPLSQFLNVANGLYQLEQQRSAMPPPPPSST
eukprot:2921705-Amphidinium_carterae.2